MKFKDIFNHPKVICVCGNVNEAKTNLLYYLLEGLKAYGNFNLYTYGLRTKIPGAITIFSVNELEQIKDSIVILDELMSLWDLDNRKAKKQIETTLRLINHNNNILVICALPENLKKFICGKVNEWFFKKCTLADFIQGSMASRICNEYKGVELGSSVLTMEKWEALYFDGRHYYKINIPYIKKYDSKKANIKIVQKNVRKINKKVGKDED
jgi:hypothetical protein